jgi:hypothetical protein
VLRVYTVTKYVSFYDKRSSRYEFHNRLNHEFLYGKQFSAYGCTPSSHADDSCFLRSKFSEAQNIEPDDRRRRLLRNGAEGPKDKHPKHRKRVTEKKEE